MRRPECVPCDIFAIQLLSETGQLVRYGITYCPKEEIQPTETKFGDGQPHPPRPHLTFPGTSEWHPPGITNKITLKGHFSTLTGSIALILFLIEFKSYSISRTYLQIEIL